MPESGVQTPEQQLHPNVEKTGAGPHRTMKFGSTTEVLAKHVLKYQKMVKVNSTQMVCISMSWLPSSVLAGSAMMQKDEDGSQPYHMGMMSLSASFGPGTKHSSRGSWL